MTWRTWPFEPLPSAIRFCCFLVSATTAGFAMLKVSLRLE
jgi:hypothetical protein